jgi:transposase
MIADLLVSGLSMSASHSLERAEDVVQSLDALRTQLSGRSGVDDSAKDVLLQASELIAQLRELVSTLDGQLAAMRWLAQKQYRPKSEHVPPGQLALDLLGFLLLQPKPAGDSAPDASSPTADEARSKPPPREKRKSRLHLLPVEQVERRLAENERVCPCCSGIRAEMGSESRRHLIYEPARLYIREELLFKYACRKCSEGVAIAEGTPKLIEGSNVSSSVLSHLVVSKVVDAVPIERVGKQLARHGADFASSTLNEWYGRCGEEVAFLQPLAHQELLRSQMISLDDTPTPTKDSGAPHGIVRGRLWLYLGDVSRIAYCEYSPDWKGSHPQRVLQGFGGPIQNDGYSGLHALFCARDAPPRVGCNDHARRKCVEALRVGDTRVEGVLALYSALYAVERDAKGLDAEATLTLRQQKSVPLWAALRDEYARLAALGERKSPLGKAVTYFQRQEPRLAAYLSNGILPISNAHVERLLRTVALFRKNSLFIGSPAAGPRYAALLTLALNCALRDVNPFHYFTELFDRIAGGWPSIRAIELLPRNAAQPSEAVE